MSVLICMLSRAGQPAIPVTPIGSTPRSTHRKAVLGEIQTPPRNEIHCFPSEDHNRPAHPSVSTPAAMTMVTVHHRRERTIWMVWAMNVNAKSATKRAETQSVTSTGSGGKDVQPGQTKRAGCLDAVEVKRHAL